VADTANIKYGYNFNYVDSVKIFIEIYPTGFATKPQPTFLCQVASFQQVIKYIKYMTAPQP
jgi:hypothetical protein